MRVLRVLIPSTHTEHSYAHSHSTVNRWGGEVSFKLMAHNNLMRYQEVASSQWDTLAREREGDESGEQSTQRFAVSFTHGFFFN